MNHLLGNRCRSRLACLTTYTTLSLAASMIIAAVPKDDHLLCLSILCHGCGSTLLQDLLHCLPPAHQLTYHKINSIGCLVWMWNAAANAVSTLRPIPSGRFR